MGKANMLLVQVIKYGFSDYGFDGDKSLTVFGNVGCGRSG